MCAVAISNSPVFSPSPRVSSTIFCKSSPESCSSSPSFKFRLQKPPPPVSGLFRASNDDGPASCSSTSPTQLKRKRPTRLNIPVASLSFPADRSTPCAVEDRWKEVEVEEDGYSVYCKRGKRETMEDRFKANVNFSEKHKQAFFGVYDGHGGSKAAEFVSENLQNNIRKEVEKRGEIEIVEAIKQGYLNTDSEFLKQEERGGACCVTAVITSGNLVVSNAGDCRAVVSREGAAEPLTSDHRPSRPDEKQRIESLGGYVDCSRGVSRVLGSLAVSRGIGDRSLKQWITAEPETKVFKIMPQHEFLIMASDGLWEKVSNQESVDVARPFCASNDKSEVLSACKKLVELSASRGSVDDTSVMIIQLGRFC